MVWYLSNKSVKAQSSEGQIAPRMGFQALRRAGPTAFGSEEKIGVEVTSSGSASLTKTVGGGAKENLERDGVQAPHLHLLFH